MSLLLVLLACTQPAPADTDPTDTDPTGGESFALKVVGFNLESGENDYDRIAEETVGTTEGEALWGFSEVDAEWAAEIVVDAANDDGDQDFDFVIGSTSWEDLLVLAWDDAAFALESWDELHEMNINGTGRAPLVGRMRHRESDTEFLFLVNHLWRTDDDARHRQAEMLNEWAQEQRLPIVAVGDYNFDWDVPSDGDDYHDRGYDLMTEGGVWEWVRPDPLERTQCAWGYDNVLDFTFVANDAQDWPVESSRVMEVDRHYCDTDQDERSDHIPVEATFRVPI